MAPNPRNPPVLECEGQEVWAGPGYLGSRKKEAEPPWAGGTWSPRELCPGENLESLLVHYVTLEHKTQGVIRTK